MEPGDVWWSVGVLSFGGESEVALDKQIYRPTHEHVSLETCFYGRSLSEPQDQNPRCLGPRRAEAADTAERHQLKLQA